MEFAYGKGEKNGTVAVKGFAKAKKNAAFAFDEFTKEKTEKKGMVALKEYAKEEENCAMTVKEFVLNFPNTAVCGYNDTLND